MATGSACTRWREAPAILPLLRRLELVEDRSHWDYKFRFGLFKISDADMRLVAQATQVDLPSLNFDSLLF